jgi:hypothetical protein
MFYSCPKYFFQDFSVANKLSISIYALLVQLKADEYRSMLERMALTHAKKYYTYKSTKLETLQSLQEIIASDPALKSSLETIIQEPWACVEGIDVANFVLSRDYVEQKLVAHQDKPAFQVIKKIIITTIATKMFFEAKKINASIPSNRLTTLAAVITDFRDLADGNGKDKGQKAVGYYVEDLRQKCSLQTGRELSYKFTLPSFIGVLMHCIDTTHDLTGLTKKLEADFLPSRSKPSKVTSLCEKIERDYHGRPIENYLNLFGGWGYMLVGAMATPSIKRYIDTDPHAGLLARKQQMVSDLGYYKAAIKMHTTTVHLYDKPMQNLTDAELMPDGVQNDLSYFSPPYFNMERYDYATKKAGKKNNEQSYATHPDFSDWFHHIFLYSIFQSHKALREGGFLAVHLGNISLEKRKPFDFSSAFNNRMTEVRNYFTYKGTLDYLNTSSVIHGGSTITIYQKNTNNSAINTHVFHNFFSCFDYKDYRAEIAKSPRTDMQNDTSVAAVEVEEKPSKRSKLTLFSEVEISPEAEVHPNTIDDNFLAR